MIDNEYVFRKIHFMKIYDYGYYNQGDILCSPFLWFNDFFDKYSCISHSLSSIDYNQIGRSDIVIIGGGGILNYNPWFNFNAAIEKLLSICDNVILWGCGFNAKINNEGEFVDYTPELDFSKFSIYGLRDYNLSAHRYVPCVSCMNPLLCVAYHTVPKKRVGSMLHPLMEKVHLPIDVDNCSHFENIETIMNFISEHEIIITNSYHAAYWSLLANRKVISPASLLRGSKFLYMKYKPSFCKSWTDDGLLNLSMGEATNYPHYLDESIHLTNSFFEEVKKVVEEMIPIPDKTYEKFYEHSINAGVQWFEKIRVAEHIEN